MDNRPSIFDYFTTRATVPKTTLTDLIDFLLHYVSLVQTPATSKALFATKAMVTTPLTMLATQAVALGMDQLFAVMIIPPKTVAMPEIFTFRHLPFDLAQFPPELTAAFQALPQLRNKIVVNLTPFLKTSGQFADITGFQNTMVRDLLTRSFFTSTTATWLTPRIAWFVAKTYNMSLGSTIAEWFQLDIRQRGIVSTILAFYMLQQMSSAQYAEVYIRNQRRYLYLPEVQDLEQIFGLIIDTNGTLSLTTLEQVYATINAIGIPRLQVNRRVIITRVQKWGPDLYTTSLALEHPAYFIYLILLCLSGSKIGLSFKLKALGMLRESEVFAEELLHCATFLPSVT